LGVCGRRVRRPEGNTLAEAAKACFPHIPPSFVRVFLWGWVLRKLKKRG